MSANLVAINREGRLISLPTIDGIPVVEVDARATDTGDGRRYWQLTFPCPFCYKSPRSTQHVVHSHGGGDASQPLVDLGHRVAHCMQQSGSPLLKKGYFLVLRGARVGGFIEREP